MKKNNFWCILLLTILLPHFCMPAEPAKAQRVEFPIIYKGRYFINVTLTWANPDSKKNDPKTHTAELSRDVKTWNVPTTRSTGQIISRIDTRYMSANSYPGHLREKTASKILTPAEIANLQSGTAEILITDEPPLTATAITVRPKEKPSLSGADEKAGSASASSKDLELKQCQEELKKLTERNKQLEDQVTTYQEVIRQFSEQSS